jgi:hypothetical protein
LIPVDFNLLLFRRQLVPPFTGDVWRSFSRQNSCTSGIYIVDPATLVKFCENNWRCMKGGSAISNGGLRRSLAVVGGRGKRIPTADSRAETGGIRSVRRHGSWHFKLPFRGRASKDVRNKVFITLFFG